MNRFVRAERHGKPCIDFDKGTTLRPLVNRVKLWRQRRAMPRWTDRNDLFLAKSGANPGPSFLGQQPHWHLCDTWSDGAIRGLMRGASIQLIIPNSRRKPSLASRKKSHWA